MDLLVGIILVVLLVLGGIAAFFDKSPRCQVCQTPVYKTKVGIRHKPGHAPSDGHLAVLEESGKKL